MPANSSTFAMTELILAIPLAVSRLPDRQTGGKSLQVRPDGKLFADIFDRNFFYIGAVARDAHQKATFYQGEEGSPHGGTADAELPEQLVFNETLTGFVLPLHDRVDQKLCDLIRQGRHKLRHESLSGFRHVVPFSLIASPREVDVEKITRIRPLTRSFQIF